MSSFASIQCWIAPWLSVRNAVQVGVPFGHPLAA